MREINIEPLCAGNEKEWDRLVEESHNGHLMAKSGFFRYHEDRFEDASLLLRCRSRPLGVIPGNVDGDTFWSHQGVSFGGLILRRRARFGEVGTAVAALLEHLQSRGCARLMYRPAPHPYHRQPRDEDVYFLEQAGARRVETKLHSMLICRGGATASSQKWRRDLRRARRSGVRIRAGHGDDLPRVWEQVERLLALHGQRPVHSLDDIRLLCGRFPENVRLTVAEGAGGDFLAGMLTLHFGRTITALYLGETEAGREACAGKLINQQHIGAEENEGCWFDLGQWCDTDSREGSDSLLMHKELMGGRLVQRHTWELQL